MKDMNHERLRNVYIPVKAAFRGLILVSSACRPTPAYSQATIIGQL